ncbi:PPC domain-containing protein [Microcoleus sp. LAD1_D5]|uniref:PPC domain-containing protein n=1 Tax=unclassified Microcoleus TaxID=2642155 RepID=UPI002FCF396E
MGQLVIGLFGVVILAIIALVIVGSSLRFPLPTQTTPPPTKSNAESYPSPALNPFPIKETSSIASPPPSPVEIPADQNPCKAEQNGNTVNLGFLEDFCPFVGNLSSNNREIRYRFTIANPSNISLFLDDVNSTVEMYLYSDKDGTGIIEANYGYTSAYKSQSAKIKKQLEEGSYIVVVKLKTRETKYSLQIVNDTSQVENVGFLEQKTIPKNGIVSLKKREKFYGFQLDNPSSISLSLDGVTSEVEMYLYSSEKGGVIGTNYGYTSASNSTPGLIKKQELGAGYYIVVVRFQARETHYTLTMSAP